MPREPSLRFHVYAGPSLFAPFPSVVAEFPVPSVAPLGAAKIASYLAGAPTAALPDGVEQPNGDMTFERVVAFLTRVMQSLSGAGDLPLEMRRTGRGSAFMAIGFHDQRVAINAVRSALHIASMAFAAEQHGTDQGVASAIEQAARMMHSIRGEFPTRQLMRAARARHIPVYPVATGSGFWLFGQGSVGKVFSGAATHDNSLIGSLLARNKFLSNQLVVQLGFPGVEHGFADSFDAATRIARQLGFPVAVKPVDLSKGRGVSANVVDEEELRTAFAKAQAVTKEAVLVERHVPGDDHRIAVFGGKLIWVSRRSPARVVGDGRSTVAELIDLENNNRSEANVAASVTRRLEVDVDMRAVLAKQGLSLEDRPAAGRPVALRSVANLATGGTISDCTASIHPDNREMAEAIARGFHDEAVGIDFMTTDISRSWRELPCAVIEVNAAPGFAGEARADQILAETFPPGRDGRLPSIVLIEADRSTIERVIAAVRPFVQRVGQTDANVTLLAGQGRCKPGDSLSARVQALILDPGCDALVVSATTQDIERHGFPLDRCDLALIAGTTALPAPMRSLINACAGQVLDGVTAENLELGALPAIATQVRKKVMPVRQ